MPSYPLIDPIPGPDAGGIDLAFLPEFDAIQEARRADDPSLDQGEWARELKSADWPAVVRLCQEALCERTKDLRIAGWYLEARTHIDGLRGLAEGFEVIASLCEGLWSDLHPRGDDNDERLGCLRWTVSQSLRWIPAAPRLMGNEADAAARACLAALDRLEMAVDDEVPGEGPSLTAVREALRDVLADTHPAPERLPPALAADIPSVLTTTDRVYREPTALSFSHRDDALDCLRDVAHFFRETEPHSPVAYLADKAARWGDMPLHEWLQQVLGEGDALVRMRDLLDLRVGQDPA